MRSGACLLIAVLLASVAFADRTFGPAAGDPGPTPAEADGFSTSPTYGATWAYLRSLAAASRHITVAAFGHSAVGNPLPVVFVWDRSGPGGAWEDGTPKPVVMIVAGVHSGEICGNDALQLLLRDIARGREPGILAHLRLLIVPILNVDGGGTRHNAQGLDISRDYAKLQTAECRALVRLAAQFNPHVFLDLHTDDGGGQGHDVLFGQAVNPTFPGDRARLLREELAPHVIDELAAHGFRASWNVAPRDRQDPRPGLRTYGLGLHNGAGYYETRQAISIHSEAHAHLPYERRVRVTAALVRAVLHFAARERLHLCAVVNEARALATRWGREPGRHAIGFSLSADERPAGRQIAFTAAMPRGYLMDAAWGEVAGTLKRHAIGVHRLSQPLSAEIEVYRIKEADFRAQPYQGHHPITHLSGDWTRETRQLPPGTYWIPLDQPAGLTAMHLLEPESQDALLVWNAFDAIFGRGSGEQYPRYPVYRYAGQAPPHIAP